MNEKEKTLEQAVVENPFPEFQEWWEMGEDFISFMADAVVSEWAGLYGNDGALDPVREHASHFVEVVYGREVRADLVDDFVNKVFVHPVHSGEFDGLSYAFYRAAFEAIERNAEAYDGPLETERRLFTKRVGKRFFSSVHDRQQLSLPTSLEGRRSFSRLRKNIETVGEFLVGGGYLRDHFEFMFTVDVELGERTIRQTEADFPENLHDNGVAYAIYEMGYPAILPSAVYLYNTMGEAQHHSSRTIEALFERVGYEARETADFDPTDYPSDRVVELWEIRKLEP